MTFKSKKDRFFINLIIMVVIVIWIFSFVPFMIELSITGDLDLVPFFIVMSIFFLTSIFILWTVFDIEYTFYEDYLLVRGGPFRSRIPFSKIQGYRETNNIWMGYRICASKDALEIMYSTGFMGSVIISPENKKLFIEELEKRMKN